MDKRGNEIIVFGALISIMLLTIGLTFFMNRQFVQVQLKENLMLEATYTRDRFMWEISKELLLDEAYDINKLFESDSRSNQIQVNIFDDFGLQLTGSGTYTDRGLTPIISRMLSGDQGTMMEQHLVYSFGNVEGVQGNLYIMVEMSDQRYRQGIRNYYYRMFIAISLVSAMILLLGYKVSGRIDEGTRQRGSGGMDE